MDDTKNIPAFPGVAYKEPVGGGAHMMTIIGGMTLRDYFAGKAIPVVLSQLWQMGEHESPIPPLAAKFSYEIADAMLRAREAA